MNATEQGVGSRARSPAMVIVDLLKVAWPFAPAGLALVFGVQRLSTWNFYNRFDVTPQEVGIGDAESIFQSVAAFLIVLVLANVLVLFVFVIAALRRWTLVKAAVGRWWAEARPRPGPVVRYLLHRISIAVVGVGAVVLAKRFGTVWAIGGGVLLAVLFGMEVQNPFTAQAQRTRPAFSEVWVQRVAVGVTTVVSLAFLVVVPLYQSGRDADAAARGADVSGVPAVPWQARPATITWLQEPVVAGFDDHCLLYLGQANEVTVVFDVDQQTTFRLPSSSLILRTGETAGSPCPAGG